METERPPSMLQTTDRLVWSPDSAIQDCSAATPRQAAKLSPIVITDISAYSAYDNINREPRGLLLKKSSPRGKSPLLKSEEWNTHRKTPPIGNSSSSSSMDRQQAATQRPGEPDCSIAGIPVTQLWSHDRSLVDRSDSAPMGWSQSLNSPITRHIHRSNTDDGLPAYVKIDLSDLFNDDYRGKFVDPLDTPEHMSADNMTSSRANRRDQRQRPWTNGMDRNKLKLAETHYEQCLPKDKWMNMRTMQYTTNPRWGQAYQIRRHASSNKPFKPETETWLTENDFRIWLLEKSKATKLELSFGPDGPFVMSDRKINGRRRLDKIGGHRDLYHQFHSERLRKEKQQESAVMIQKHVRGWLVRAKMQQLKQQVTLHHGMSYAKYTKEYKSLLVRTQKRHSVNKPSAVFDLKQLETHLHKKLKYEMAFHSLAHGDKIPRNQLVGFFNECGLQPRETDIDKAFFSVFKGCGSRAEVALMIDCSAEKSDQQTKLQKSFLKEVVRGLEISPGAVRVSIVPFNSASMESFSLGAFDNKEDILQALETMSLKSGNYSTEVSVRHMRDIMSTARPGVPKTCILVTDGKLKVNLMAEKEAKVARQSDIAMFVVGVGNTAENRDLLALASTPDHVYKMTDYYAVKKIKEQVMRKVCLKSCDYCNGGTVEEDPFHFQVYNKDTQKIEDANTAEKGPLERKNSTIASRGGLGRGLKKHEAMELLWTLYPPEAAGLTAVNRSTWMRPLVDDMQYTDIPEADNDAEFDKCLELVLKSQIQRKGSIVMPVGAKDVEEVDNYETAFKHARDYIKREKLRQDIPRQRQDMLKYDQDNGEAFDSIEKASILPQITSPRDEPPGRGKSKAKRNGNVAKYEKSCSKHNLE